MSKVILFSNATETKEEVIACGIYAHGDLERKLGYDVVCPRYAETEDERGWILPDLPSEGVYDAVIQHLDEQIPCKLFYWTSQYSAHRGLAVLESDTDSMRFAKERYDRKENHI